MLTPVVGAFSGSVSAAAMAGIGSAICRSPPVMMCNPEEPAGNTVVERDFNANSYKGIGIRLLQGDTYAPGAFGFLDTDYGNGANNLLAAIGWNSPPGECVDAAGVEINNGQKTSVMDGFNARFDVPGSGTVCPTIGGVAGVCHPSVNVRKDLVRPANNCNWDTNDANSGNFATRNYRPTTAAVYPSGTTPDIMGHPRDLCHAWGATGNCNGVNGGKGERIGTGDWDIQAYWRSNYGGAAYTNQVSTTTYGSQPKGYPTRYQVYRYELDNLSTINTPKAGAGSSSAYSVPQSGSCLASSASPYGVLPSAAGYDRRKLTIAVLNCNALSASGSLNNRVLAVGPQNWADVFLVEPAFARDRCKGGSGGCNTKYSDQKDVYVEVVGRTNIAGGGETAQTVRKDVPYLVK